MESKSENVIEQQIKKCDKMTNKQNDINKTAIKWQINKTAMK